MINSKIWLSSPHMGGNELNYIHDAFDSNWIAPLGPNVDAFEIDIQKYVRVPHVAVLNSGTAAIHLALILCDVQPGDDVICQSFTFSASANPIKYLGANPVFIDSEAETWNMSPEFLEQAILDRFAKGKKIKAIIPVHLYGMPARMNEIVAIANKYAIPIIEDAAEGLGSRYHSTQLGAFGKFGILSFNGNKIITTSGGGALLSADKEAIERARFLATQARRNTPHYEHSEVGYNYRMSNICAGIGRGQMQVLNERVSARRQNFIFYKESLKVLSSIEFLEEPENFYSNRWLTTILVNKQEGISRENLRIELEKNFIESRPLWKPMHTQQVFNGCPFYGDGTSEKLFENGLCLPSGSNLSPNDLTRVVSVIKKLYA